ncbi:hypothetical protein HAX54_040384, partial [Datura stramonium]|nr:hypothetical protein [Datura stramonium]
MDTKHASSSASRSKALVGWGAGHGTNPGGSRAGAQTRAILSLKLLMGVSPELLLWS